jgi:hypothetical protein
MTNEREEEAVARAKRQALTREGLRQAVLQTKDDVEIPLRDALGLVHVLSLVGRNDERDVESIALVAKEAARRLEIVTDELRGLFRACVLEI